MVNWAVPPALLMPYVPRGVVLDPWEGRHWMSLVGFRFLDTRIGGVRIPFHQEFCEVNLRFYVGRLVAGEWRRGVVFLRELVARRAVTALARWCYHENYLTLPMRAAVSNTPDACEVEYGWRSRSGWSTLAARSTAPWEDAGPEAKFITEHFWGYSRQRDGATREYRVDHPMWRVRLPESLRVEGAFEETYGENFAQHLRRAPDSAFVADGSAVSVFAGTRLGDHL